MRVEWALRKTRGISKVKHLAVFGITRDEIYTAMLERRISRIRNGWYGLPTANASEVRAIRDRGLLTCAAAARVLGLPAQFDEYHIRAARPVPGIRTTCRRTPPSRMGGMVSLVDLVEDYASCQPPAWTLALLDALVRERRVKAKDLNEIESRLAKSKKYLIKLTSTRAESALESVARYHLVKDRTEFQEQVPIGPYRVDFLIGKRLVLETHGAEFHAGKENWERDRARTLWLREHGWDVLELTYSQVANWAEVRRAIRSCLKNPRYLSPQGRDSDFCQNPADIS